MTNQVIEKLKKQYQGKKVLVVGLGLQGGGVGIAKFFCDLGAQVFVTDKKTEEQLSTSVKKLEELPIKFTLGRHKLADFLTADVIFKGPSVPWDLPELIEAQKKNIPIEMELSFFVKHSPAKTVGVTGTRGKSTTAHLIFEILKQSGFSVYLGGNLPGISTINFLKTATSNDWVVIELSSWALSGFHRRKISPHIAVFTNFYPDHLNYYQNIDQYLYDKEAIFLYQKKEDWLVVNRSLEKLLSPLSVKDKNIFFFDKNDFPCPLKYLKGDHNRENAAASLAVAKILKIDERKAINIICHFKGLPYRQEVVGKKEDIIFVNDTTSTTPIATIKAIDTFKDQKIVLILGGNSKNLPFGQLIEKLKVVEEIILLKGTFTDQILTRLKGKFSQKISNKIYNNLKEAVEEAYRLAKNKADSHRKTIILFSPAATSFSMFNNEFERGEEFNRIVNKILNSKF